jgi:hypothetical protein
MCGQQLHVFAEPILDCRKAVSRRVGMMSSVIESSQLTFDWDIVAESNFDSADVGQSNSCEIPDSLRMRGARPAQVSSTRCDESVVVNRVTNTPRPRGKQDRAEHIGGLMLQVLARYGISQDEFLQEYDRQMRAKNS